MYFGLGMAILFLLIAAARGLQLSVRTGPAILALAMFGALRWARRRHERPGGDPRLASSSGIILVLLGGGLAGGMICLVGQTFALPLIDPMLHRADLMLGVDVEAAIETVVQFRGVPDLLAAAYNSSFPLIFLSALGFAWTGRTERAWELCAVFNLCLLVATISSAVIPAVGPLHYLQIPAAVRDALPAGSGTYHLGDLFALREANHFVIDPMQLQGVATFPSFHMALALMTAAAWRDIPRARVPMYAWQALVVVSTVPIGGHYFVDLVAGAMCWALAHVVWHKAMSAAPRRHAARDASLAWPEAARESRVS
jgi:membrane-associated phospholipid phosphatase